MTEAITPGASPASTSPAASTVTLDQLTAKYGTTSSVAAQRGFDAGVSGRQSLASTVRRMGAKPVAGRTDDTGAIHKEFADIQMSLAALAEEYGKLNVRFSDILGKDGYSVSALARIALYTLTGQRDKVRSVKLDAIGQRGDQLGKLVDRMAEALQEQHQYAVRGVAHARQIQTENLAQIKRLDDRLVDSLDKSTYKGEDHYQAQRALEEIEADLANMDARLMEYEGRINAARQSGDVATAGTLTGEMRKALQTKYAILDRRLQAEETAAEIRRQIIDSAEGTQSAKGAGSAAKVNYRATTALIDAMTELEIKYRYALEDMIPVFRQQALIAMQGDSALEMRDALLKVAAVSERLMEFNARVVTHLAAQTFELIQTPLYDPAKAAQLERSIADAQQVLNQAKIEWAQGVQSASSLAEHAAGSGYVRPR